MSINKIDITLRLDDWDYLQFLVGAGYRIKTDGWRVFAVRYLDA